MFTFGSDILAVHCGGGAAAFGGCADSLDLGVAGPWVAWRSVVWRAEGTPDGRSWCLAVVIGAERRGLWRRAGEAGEGLAAAAPGLGREPGGGALGVAGLAGLPGGEDLLVAGDEQAGEPERERGQAREAAPASGHVVAGGVLGGGEGPLGTGAPCVGAAVRRGGVVVFLPGLGRDFGRDGDG